MCWYRAAEIGHRLLRSQYRLSQPYSRHTLARLSGRGTTVRET